MLRYKILSEANSNFDKWHIYISDERFLTKDHQDRNDVVIKNIWLNNNRIPEKNIHFIYKEDSNSSIDSSCSSSGSTLRRRYK